MTKQKVIYGKPLLRDLPTDADLESIKQNALENAGKYAVEEIQREIKKSSWNNAPTNLLKSFTVVVKDSSMEIHSNHPAAKYLDKGVKPHQMIHLLDAKKPIPIITDSGDVIFRTPSAASMAQGGWQHSGFKGKHFLQRGVEKAKERVKEEIKEVYKDLIMNALTGNKK